MSAIFLKIFSMSISASWIAAAVLVLRLCLKRAPKWISVLLWGLVGVRLTLPFSIESTLSLLPRTEVAGPASMAEAGRAAAAATGGAAVVSGAAASPAQTWLTMLAWAWLAGVTALFLYAALSTLRLRRRVCEAVRLRENIYQSGHIDLPFVLGTLRPKIYLPYHMDACGQRNVIAHEQAHLRRGDHVWKPLGFLLLTIHWFNPLMWLSYVRLCRDIELACDERVIKGLDCGQRADYMQALVTCSVKRRGIAACPLAFGEIGVKERVKAVMNYKKPTFWIILLAVIACVVLAVCFLTDPKDAQPDRPADTSVSETDNTPDPVNPAQESPAQPEDPGTEKPAQPTESDALKQTLSETEADKQRLDKAIGKAVLDHYADTVQADQIHVESHFVLAKDESSAGNITVYLLVLQETYSTDGGALTVENGSYVPTAITFAVSASGEYTLEEYWEPRDGSYSDDVRDKFPADAAEKALNDQAYIDDLKAICDQTAEAAIRAEQ